MSIEDQRDWNEYLHIDFLHNRLWTAHTIANFWKQNSHIVEKDGNFQYETL